MDDVSTIKKKRVKCLKNKALISTGVRFDPAIKSRAKKIAKLHGIYFNEFIQRAVDKYSDEMLKETN